MRLIDADVSIEKMKSLPIELDAETIQRCIEVLSNMPSADWDLPSIQAEHYAQGFADGYKRGMKDAEPKTGECRTCGRNADNGGVHEDGRTKCPIQEHYALLLDGYCHLYEPYNCGAKMVREDGEA